MAGRIKAKKKVNRYNPSQPDWAAVHRPGYQNSVILPVGGLLDEALLLTGILFRQRLRGLGRRRSHASLPS